jgi:hypothetical protein
MLGMSLPEADRPEVKIEFRTVGPAETVALRRDTR